MTHAPIRVLIVDDHAIVRKGIRATLTETGGFEVAGEAADGLEAVRLAAELYPDVILMDLLMPRLDGIDAIRQITAARPGARILVLTSFAADDKIFPAIKAGALGYLLKDSSPDDLVHGIYQVYHGEPSLHPTIARRLMQEIVQPLAQEAPPGAGAPYAGTEALTERELEVLNLIGRGHGNRQIAEQLVISEPTVRAHVSNILGKLHLASRTQAALYAVRAGLVDGP